MKVAVLETVGSLNNIKLVDRPEPRPGPGEVLVRLRAAALNYRDLVVVEGGYGSRQKSQKWAAMSPDGKLATGSWPASSQNGTADRRPRTGLRRALAVRSMALHVS